MLFAALRDHVFCAGAAFIGRTRYHFETQSRRTSRPAPWLRNAGVKRPPEANRMQAGRFDARQQRSGSGAIAVKERA
jgi:hypothetical protein